MGNSTSISSTDKGTLNLINPDGSICDANCQKQQSLTQLQNTLQNAKSNLSNAPTEYQAAKKNYLVELNGKNAYNQSVEDNLTKKAGTIATTLQNNFNKNCQQASTLLSNYQGTYVNLNNILDLLKKYIDDNTQLKNEINNLSSDVVTNDRKTYYEDQSLDNLKKYYKWMKYIYYFMALIYLFVVYFYPNPLSNKTKIIIFVIMLIYPYIIDPIFKYLFKLLFKILSYLPKDVYHTLGYFKDIDF